jgi:hypothetical protein
MIPKKIGTKTISVVTGKSLLNGWFERPANEMVFGTTPGASSQVSVILSFSSHFKHNLRNLLVHSIPFFVTSIVHSFHL